MRRAASLMIAIVLVLIALGIVMLYSTSSARSAVPHFYLYRQLLWLCLSIIAGTFVAKLDYHHWRRFAIPLVIVTLVLLVLVFVQHQRLLRRRLLAITGDFSILLLM